MNTDSVCLLCEQVLGDAGTEAEAILKNASETILEKTALAEREMEKTLAGMTAKANRDTGQEIKKLQSRINIEKMRKASAVKERRIDSVIALLDRKMSSRKDILLKLVSEAASSIGENEVRILLGGEERRVLGEGFIKELNLPGISATLEPPGETRGIRVLSADGRIMFDNSCRAKIARDKDKIRSVIGRWLK